MEEEIRGVVGRRQDHLSPEFTRKYPNQQAIR